MPERILNLAFRFSSLACRFLLIFLITRYLTVYDLGVFGLLNTTVTLGVFFVGLEFYKYNCREIVGKTVDEQAFQFYNQLALHAVTYVLLIPVTVFIFAQGLLPTEFSVVFLLILVLEHLGQEQYRLLIVLCKPLQANFILFIRNAFWVLVLFAVWLLDIGESRSLVNVFRYWVVGAAAALAVGFYYIHRAGVLIPKRLRVDISLILTGIKVSVPFFVGTAALKAMEFSDRYFIDYFLGKEALGVFTFYIGIAKVMTFGVYTMVALIYYPRLLEFVNTDPARFDFYKKTMLRETFLYTVLFSLPVIFGIEYALIIFDKPQLEGQNTLLWLLLAGQVVLCFSFIPNCVLYAYKRDRAILFTAMLAATVTILLNFALIPEYGLQGAAIAGLVSYSLKWAVEYRLTR